MTNLIWLAGIPVVLFAASSGVVFLSRFFIDESGADKWWSFPAWMSFFVPMMLLGLGAIIYCISRAAGLAR